mmetsp:Transcript_63102/g.131168  ORF Transcript_63102/g.131168 Transcript_63102/m.131168 type:complete len:90 (-) Transcript_63102:139-408(-)
MIFRLGQGSASDTSMIGALHEIDTISIALEGALLNQCDEVRQSPEKDTSMETRERDSKGETLLPNSWSWHVIPGQLCCGHGVDALVSRH